MLVGLASLTVIQQPMTKRGAGGDPSRGTATAFSFATDCPEGFGDDHLTWIGVVVPAVSLAVMSDAECKIAAGLLGAYLGADTGKRVHAGEVKHGSVESISAVLWYAEIRSLTAIADATPGLVVVEMLDDVFELLTAALRRRGGEVLDSNVGAADRLDFTIIRQLIAAGVASTLEHYLFAESAKPSGEGPVLVVIWR